MPPTKTRAKTVRKPKAASAPAKKAERLVTRAPHIPEAKPIASEPEAIPERYWEAVGRRKTAVARVRLYAKGEKGIWVNQRPASEYFPYPAYRGTAGEALALMNSEDRLRVSAKVSGGGPHAQAEAIRHGTARALTLFNPEFRKRLKRAGFLRRDPRMKERKKFGLKGARRAPQWQKR